MKIRLKYLIPSFALTAQILCARVASAEEAPPQGCSALTREAFDGLVATLKDSINQANTDCTRFCAGGAYASAPQANLDYLVIVRDQVLDLVAWLAEVEGDVPYVTNTSAAYSVHGLARDAILSLHHARHWATISATYHRSGAAQLSFDKTTQAIHQLEAIGENGGLCYMAAYGPFSN